jgi:hypothetical protein
MLFMVLLGFLSRECDWLLMDQGMLPDDVTVVLGHLEVTPWCLYRSSAGKAFLHF